MHHHRHHARGGRPISLIQVNHRAVGRIYDAA